MSPHNNMMQWNPGLRVVVKWVIARSGLVNIAVVPLN